MPAIRRQDVDDEYQPNSSPSTPSSRTKYARRAAITLAPASTDVLPFPIGAPYEPVHHALLSFCAPYDSSLVLGTADNLVTFLMFATKNTTIRPLSLVVTPFPNALDYTRSFTRATRRIFHALPAKIQDKSPIDWLPDIVNTMTAMSERVSDTVLRDTLLSDSLHRCVGRYLMLKNSTQVRVGKVLFPGHPTAQAAVKATQPIPTDTYLWELSATLSSDSTGLESVSSIEPHACQRLSPGPRMMAGGARFANHNCNPNSVVSSDHFYARVITQSRQLEPIPDYAIFVIKTLRDVSAGEEVTVDYGTQYWIDGKCPCSSCTGQAPLLDIIEMRTVVDNSNPLHN